jgi:hypothetical protein
MGIECASVDVCRFADFLDGYFGNRLPLQQLYKALLQHQFCVLDPSVILFIFHDESPSAYAKMRASQLVTDQTDKTGAFVDLNTHALNLYVVNQRYVDYNLTAAFIQHAVG